LHLGATDWRWKFSIAAVPALVFYLALFFIPESPRWLAGKGKTREALEVLQRNGDPDPELELREITKSLEDAIGSKGTNVFQWRYRFPIFWPFPLNVQPTLGHQRHHVLPERHL